MDTDSLYLAVAEKELEDCLRPEIESECGNNCDQKYSLIASLKILPWNML